MLTGLRTRFGLATEYVNGILMIMIILNLPNLTESSSWLIFIVLNTTCSSGHAILISAILTRGRNSVCEIWGLRKRRTDHHSYHSRQMEYDGGAWVSMNLHSSLVIHIFPLDYNPLVSWLSATSYCHYEQSIISKHYDQRIQKTTNILGPEFLRK